VRAEMKRGLSKVVEPQITEGDSRAGRIELGYRWVI